MTTLPPARTSVRTVASTLSSALLVADETVVESRTGMTVPAGTRTSARTSAATAARIAVPTMVKIEWLMAPRYPRGAPSWVTALTGPPGARGGRPGPGRRWRARPHRG